MAGFGIPVSHVDNEDRAVRAAIAMIVELWEWNVACSRPSKLMVGRLPLVRDLVRFIAQ